MKIQPAQVNKFINKIPENIRIVLLYGSDYGLIVERINTIRRAFLGSNYEETQNIRIEDNAIKQNPNIIIEESFTASLFGENKKFILVREAKDSLTKTLNDYFENPAKEVLMVFQAEELSTSSSLRKTCESAKYSHIATIPCYSDNEISLKHNILNKLPADFQISQEAIAYLLLNLGNDRGITSSELDKLLLYSHEKRVITLRDVEEVIADSMLISIDKFTYALFSYELDTAYELINNLLEEYNPVVLIRAIINHIHKLLHVKTLISTTPLEQVLQELRPPIFFAHINKFKQQVNFWESSKLKKLMEKSYELEKQLKTYSTCGNIIIKDFIIKQFRNSKTNSTQ